MGPLLVSRAQLADDIDFLIKLAFRTRFLRQTHAFLIAAEQLGRVGAGIEQSPDDPRAVFTDHKDLFAQLESRCAIVA